MLHYEDLPPLQGSTEDLARAKVVRFACLRIVQQTQGQILHLVGSGRSSVRQYHRQALAIRLAMSLYTEASWWLRPYRQIEEEIHAMWQRLMVAPFHLVQGHLVFLLAERDYVFARQLAETYPSLVQLAGTCEHCGCHIPAMSSQQRCSSCHAMEYLPPLAMPLPLLS